MDKKLARIQALGCIACARVGHHDRPALLYEVDARDPHAVIPLCHFHIHDWAGAYSNPLKFAYSNGAPLDLLQQLRDWLDYEDGKTDQIDPANPFTRNNLFIYE